VVTATTQCRSYKNGCFIATPEIAASANTRAARPAARAAPEP